MQKVVIEEYTDLFVYSLYLLCVFVVAFIVIYYLAVEFMGFNPNVSEMYTIVGLTFGIIVALLVINALKFKHWWQTL